MTDNIYLVGQSRIGGNNPFYSDHYQSTSVVLIDIMDFL